MTQAVNTIQSQHDEITALFSQVSDPETDRRAALVELTQRLAAHISVEHSVFLPAISGVGGGGRGIRRGLKRDYKDLSRLLIRIERRKVDSPDLPGMVTDLRDTFRRHERRWERVAPLVSRLPPAELEDMADRLERAEEVILSHPHPHLLSLGPLSRLTTRLAARFDRGRDRTVSNLP